ncbi:DUF366 family protein [Methanopyrus kandleri]|uniref:DUF366 family protein n=1 Tax=Methanopyrus kandleri TaxID=2320 RepID=A0A832WPL8_9EURY|nr:DUF366 family protein [Methanopyrus kandleri]HII70729.1 DUF366 family protein [Methanopyrus kandleri]
MEEEAVRAGGSVTIEEVGQWIVIVDREELEYDGSQLRRAFAHERYGIKGRAVVVFRGPMDVRTEYTADAEDVGSPIRGNDVLHLLVDDPTRADPLVAGLLQRLLVVVTKEVIEKELSTDLDRDGDDLLHDGRKLTVSVFKPAGPGSLAHLGINVTTEGVPVPASSLRDLGYRGDPLDLGRRVAVEFVREITDVELDLTKIRW